MKRLIPALVLLLFPKLNLCMDADWLASPYDPERCERPRDIRNLYICNPDGILPESDVRELETIIEKIQKETTTLCEKGETSTPGYTIRITILNKYNETLLPMPRDYNLKRGEMMQTFAKFLHTSMTEDSDSCDDGIVVFISVQDKMVHSVVGEHARSILTEDKEQAINKEAKIRLSQGRVRDTLQYILEEYDALFRDHEGSDLDEGDRTAIIAAVVAVVLIVTLLVLAIIVFRWLRGLKPHECVDAAATNTTDGQSQSELPEENEQQQRKSVETEV